MARRDLSVASHYLRGLGISTRSNSLAYGYSVAITASFGAVYRLAGSPDVGELFVFVAGAGVAFALVNAAITRGFRRRMPDEPAVVIALGTSFSIVSISAALGTACLIAWALDGYLAWGLGAFAATLVYLLAVGAEMAVAGEIHELGGPD